MTWPPAAGAGRGGGVFTPMVSGLQGRWVSMAACGACLHAVGRLSKAPFIHQVGDAAEGTMHWKASLGLSCRREIRVSQAATHP